MKWIYYYFLSVPSRSLYEVFCFSPLTFSHALVVIISQASYLITPLQGTRSCHVEVNGVLNGHLHSKSHSLGLYRDATELHHCYLPVLSTLLFNSEGPILCPYYFLSAHYVAFSWSD
ncbi:hypothetical protein XELAEV_18039670mg [Xenopus laevis]|uniref:Uncharacterized protein n=1 Tax=Xenopus laevis TaxID=8355 RepID=A0A974C999_XENLA|nr:hypothetical protein XELAEV_18039670mg [Xenopus laevis]